MKYLLLFTLFYTILASVETTTGYKPVFNPNALTTHPAHFTLSAVIDHLQTLTPIILPQTAESRAYGK